ncbi:hypothetical protein LSH36_605g02014 [Paralvinella palmiformis]|uniref:Uncharacterized protein n=1 Tax=Paralvinella palmiformis TaxID=53620 RepID=A0AAD9MWK6_9ANNE|nr:hypothetical protein LSH36_605g02014 [Paralvinella palmiformis]
MQSVQDFVKDNFSWKWVALGTAGVSVFLLRRYVAGPRCPSKVLIPGKTVIITGANCGIGRATALELAKRQGRIILACRDTQTGEEAVKYIRRRTKEGQLIVKKLDLASLKSVKSFCTDIKESEPRIDVLINNAGVFQSPVAKTEDGFEMQMGVNHLGHFYLTNLLLDKLKQSTPSRVVVVSSGLYKMGKIDFDVLENKAEPDQKRTYHNSKLANALFARELAKKLDGTGVSVYCLRPGMVRTSLGRHVSFGALAFPLVKLLGWLLVKGENDGCQTVVYCAVAKELEGVTGHFYANCKEEPWAKSATDDEVAAKLWDVSVKLTEIN